MRHLAWMLIIALVGGGTATAYPIKFTDNQDNKVVIEKMPSNVVSIVPSITEIIFRIGAGDAVSGVTHHDIYPSETASKVLVGGFFSPSLEKIRALKPDLIFISDLHEDVIGAFKDENCHLIDLNPSSVSDLYENISLLGKIFSKEENAENLIKTIQGEMQFIARKTADIPEARRKRVIRLMGRDQIMTPGDDLFQNEYIRLAGGIPPKLDKKGSIVPVTKEEWVAFNPQVIYGCGGDSGVSRKFFDQPGWKDVDAVKNGSIYYFPCDLTCRASSRAGYFVSSLFSRIYGDQLENQIVKNHIFKTDPLSLDLDYVKSANLLHAYVSDFVHKSLMIRFEKPMSVVSTLEGYREGIEFIGNNYSPPQVWGLYHKIGLEASRNRLYKALGKSTENASFLFTGADMDNLSVQQERFKDMEVFALVTAGVKSNAVRMSADEGRYYEPGTINMLLLSNMKLSKRAMTRAIISATEAKTAALWDMDIRSSQTPLINPATGTGTDNIIVAEGTGTPIDNAGGHSKMGELIAKAVYKGVQDAVYKQNGLVPKRDIFERLKERKLSLSGLVSFENCECNISKGDMLREFEILLLDPAYESFLESALAISDHYERGLIKDLTFFEAWCQQVARELAGKDVEKMQNFVSSDDVPEVVRMAFDALMNGLSVRMK